jgi:endonuclease YncB( thermonuclease family)
MILAILLAASALPSGSCRAVDGDTLRCGLERVRLVGIDAPEMPGHCARHRRCAPGDPVAARANLARLLRTGPIMITRTGRDHYGRTLALVRAGGTDLSCAQLRAGFAVYVAKWDDGRRVARGCGHITR